AGAGAGGARCRDRRGFGFSRPDHPQIDARSAYRDGDGDGRKAYRGRGRARRKGRDLWRLRRRRRDLGSAARLAPAPLRARPADPYPGPAVRGLRAEYRSSARAGGQGATLLVTVDCGTTSLEPLAEARLLGMSTVVIDHHQCGEQLPEVDALVNPNRLDDLSGLGHLAAVGLVLVTLVAVNRELRGRGFWTSEMPEPDLLGMLHHVALGTVADVAPLTGLNRAFVAKGLIAMRRRDHVGHTALMDVSRLNGPPEAWHLGFMLGPRINAGGRIGRADLGVRLLLEA